MIVFAPTKTMKQVANEHQLTEPVFLQTSNELRAILNNYSIEEIAKLMKIKNKTLETTYSYFQNEYNKTMAIDAYSGIAFKQIDSFNYEYLMDNVRIFSGLYGLLRPTDGILPYRLDFTMPKITDNTLYQIWSEQIVDYIDQYNPHSILNLASEEFIKLIRNKVSEDTQIIDLAFDQKVSSPNLKKYRGQILNHCIKHSVYDYEELEGVKFTDFTICKLTDKQLTIKLNCE